MYKEKFPAFFKDIIFQQGKTYRIDGFSDKSKPAGELAMTNIIGVKPSVGGQDELTRLLQQKFSIEGQLRDLGADDQSEEAKQLRTQLQSFDNRLEVLTTRKKPQEYIFLHLHLKRF